MTRSFRLLFVLSLFAGLAWLSSGLVGQNRTSATPSLTAGDWPHYTGDMRGWKYSPLAQIDASNVQLVDPKTGKGTRVRLVAGADGKRQRLSVKSGEPISQA